MSRGRQIVRLKLKPLSPKAKALLLDWEPGELYAYSERYPKLTSQGIFGSNTPLEVEIGPGGGDYLCYLAANQQNVNFLGIEVSKRSAAACAALAAEQDLENVRILRTDYKLLGSLLQSEAWARVYLHFPDPPHKNADQKRRIFDQAFLDQMATTLVPGGELSVASDRPAFFHKMLELAESDPRFKFAHTERFLKGFDSPVKSRFQLFWERKGIEPLRFILQKPVV